MIEQADPNWDELPSPSATSLLIGALFGAVLLIAVEIETFTAAQRHVERMADTTDAYPPAPSRPRPRHKRMCQELRTYCA